MSPPAKPSPPAPEPSGALRGPGTEFAGAAFSANTVRAVRADLALFQAWCETQGVGNAASPATVAAYVDAMAEQRAPATVRRYVASIALANRALGYEAPLESPLVQLALRRMHRRRGRRQTQATGLTWPLRQRLIDASGDRLIDARNRALVAVAYDTLLRRSELSAATVPDLALELHGGATLLVRRGKTDPEGRSATVYLAADTLALLTTWLRRACITDGPLFRSVTKGGTVGQRLDPSQVPRIYKAMAQRAGLPEEMVRGLSGHSPRVGAAQDMIAAGIGMPAILHAGRWRTPAMVSLYGQRLLVRNSGAAQLARLQRRE